MGEAKLRSDQLRRKGWTAKTLDGVTTVTSPDGENFTFIGRHSLADALRRAYAMHQKGKNVQPQ